MSRGVADFLVIGAQKSGTTTLADRLAADPGVHMPPAEVHYFTHRHDRGPDWYASTLAGAPAGALIGEKSPSYLTDPDAPARIVAALPDVRLVALLRDPVDRAYSHYWHNRRLAKEHLGFAEAVAAEPARTAGATAVEGARYGYLGGGRYADHLARFDRLFEGRVLVLVFEEMRADQAGVLDETRRFLGLAVRPAPATGGTDPPVVRNAYVEYRSQRLRRAARHLPRPLAAAVFRFNQRPAAYPPLDPGLRRELAAEFRAGDDLVAARLGRPLPWTSQRSAP